MYTVEIGGVEYEIIGEVGEWDYSWHIGALLRDADGNLFFTEDGGCSCVGFGEMLSASDLISVKNYAEAIECAKENFSDSEVYEFAKRLMSN